MPVMQQIVLADGQTPAVDHEYDPISLVNNKGDYRELTDLAYQLQASLACTVRPPSVTNYGQRTTWKLTIPVVPSKSSEDECCIPPGTTVRENHVTVEFFFDKTSPKAGAENLLAQLTSLVQDPQFIATCLGQSLR